MADRRVVVLADDLIWQTRLVAAVQAAGATATRASGLVGLEAALPGATAAIVDLTSSRYDPIVAVERSRADGVPVIAVGPHDDHPLRKRALAAGADRVFAYRKLFEDGPATLAAWLPEASPAR